MRLSLIWAFTALGGLSMAQIINAQLPAANVANGLNVLAASARTSISPAQQLSAANTRLYRSESGPWWSVIQNLRTVAQEAQAFIKSIQDTAKAHYTGGDASAIGDAFNDFYTVNVNLLDILATKGPFARQSGLQKLGPDILSSLLALGDTSDILSFYLLDRIADPGVAALMKGRIDALDEAVDRTVRAFTIG